jgi:Rieske [2Fe-2S] domain
MERVDRLTEPLVTGRFYLVPTVRAKWNDVEKEWPVIGPYHEDADRFSFKDFHYHVDARFLKQFWYHEVVAGRPLHPLPYMGGQKLPSPILRRRKCYFAWLPYTEEHRKEIVKLRADFAGQQCERGKGGWICPHRKASLGSVLPDRGVIICPLHGLAINAATGHVLTHEHNAEAMRS